MGVHKISRQIRIKELITSRDVASQDELRDLLKENGFDTTQATLSRDLNEMGIVRIQTETGFKYVFHLDDSEPAIKQFVSKEIIRVIANESLIVVRTLPGRAQGVALYLDRMKNEHMIGTVAGDDSIIIVPDHHQNIASIVDSIKKVMQ
jgi:transcriptional regulator of arginine metabolism